MLTVEYLEDLSRDSARLARIVSTKADLYLPACADCRRVVRDTCYSLRVDFQARTTGWKRGLYVVDVDARTIVGHEPVCATELLLFCMYLTLFMQDEITFTESAKIAVGMATFEGFDLRDAITSMVYGEETCGS